MSTPTIPPGGTLLDTFKKSFTDVPVDSEKDNAVGTTEFLDAAESLTTIFDAMGSVAFSPVKNDMLGNIKKLRERYLAAPAESATLQELVQNELKTKKHVATEGLVWLVRYVDASFSLPLSPLPCLSFETARLSSPPLPLFPY